MPTADMKIGPRQGDEFTLPQAAGESCVDEREYAKLFRYVQIPLAGREVRFFLHVVASLSANEQYHRKRKIATGKNPIWVQISAPAK